VNQVRIRAGGHFFLTGKNNDTTPDNRAVLNVAQVIRSRAWSSIHDTKIARPLCHTLEELGHPKGRESIQMDNLTANGVVNGKIQPKAKPWTCAFTEIKDMEAHFFSAGKNNLAKRNTITDIGYCKGVL
jgi:hypothetical protein